MDNDIKMMLKGLDGMLNSLEKTVMDSFGKMSDEDAVKFAQAMNQQKIKDKYKEAEEQINNLKKDLNFD